MTRLSLRIKLGAVLTAASLAVAGCGGSNAEGSDASGQSTELTPATVGVFAAADVAPLYLGIREGFFEAQGIDLDIQMMDSGSAVTAAVVADEFDVGYSNYLSLAIASNQGLPVTVVAPGVAGGSDPDTGEGAFTAVMASSDSDVKSLDDLEGKTVAVNALGNILELTLRSALEEEGIDPEAVTLVEVPFPEMPGALDANQIDAAFMIEPFVTSSTSQDGAEAIAFPYEIVAPSLQTGGYFTTLNKLEQDSELIQGFQEGLSESIEYVLNNPDEVPAIIPEFLDIPEDVINEISFPQFIAEVDTTHIDLLAELGMRYDLLEEEVDIQQLTEGITSR